MSEEKAEGTNAKPIIVTAVIAIFIVVGLFFLQQKKNEEPIVGNKVEENSDSGQDASSADTAGSEAGSIGKNETGLTDDTFNQEVLSYKGTFLVEFYLSTCPHCQDVAKNVTAASDDLAGKAKVGKIEARGSRMAEKYKIESVPTFIVFKNGKEVAREVGEKTKDELVQLVKKYLKK